MSQAQFWALADGIDISALRKLTFSVCLRSVPAIILALEKQGRPWNLELTNASGLSSRNLQGSSSIPASPSSPEVTNVPLCRGFTCVLWLQLRSSCWCGHLTEPSP